MPVVQGPSTGSSEGPNQHKQLSRKGKRAWRKNVDLTDVEKGLQDLNEEIIRGGVVREKASSDLFTVDVHGDSKSVTKIRKHGKKFLKADEIIAQRSVTPATSARKRPGDKTTNSLILAKRQRTDWVPHKELARLRRVADGHHEDRLVATDAQYDIWDSVAGSRSEQAVDFVPQAQLPKVPKSMKQQPISLAANGKRVPAVQHPNGGYSYNPSYTDYEKRLVEEGDKALEDEMKRLAAEEADRQRQEAIARSAAEADAAEERVNMSEWEEDSEWEGFQSGVEDEKPSTKQPKRKTQAQRNRIKRRKEEERLAQHKSAIKERRTQELRIASIAQEVDERENKQALLLLENESSNTDGDDEVLRKKQLGKFRLPNKDLELVLPDELQESLRLLKPEGNLLRDRYRNMLVQGKVESRKRIPFKKQARKKLTEKWTYKDFVF